MEQFTPIGRVAAEDVAVASSAMDVDSLPAQAAQFAQDQQTIGDEDIARRLWAENRLPGAKWWAHLNLKGALRQTRII